MPSGIGRRGSEARPSPWPTPRRARARSSREQRRLVFHLADVKVAEGFGQGCRGPELLCPLALQDGVALLVGELQHAPPVVVLYRTKCGVCFVPKRVRRQELKR